MVTVWPTHEILSSILRSATTRPWRKQKGSPPQLHSIFQPAAMEGQFPGVGAGDEGSTGVSTPVLSWNLFVSLLPPRFLLLFLPPLCPGQPRLLFSHSSYCDINRIRRENTPLSPDRRKVFTLSAHHAYLQIINKVTGSKGTFTPGDLMNGGSCTGKTGLGIKVTRY